MKAPCQHARNDFNDDYSIYISTYLYILPTRLFHDVFVSYHCETSFSFLLSAARVIDWLTGLLVKLIVVN